MKTYDEARTEVIELLKKVVGYEADGAKYIEKRELAVSELVHIFKITREELT